MTRPLAMVCTSSWPALDANEVLAPREVVAIRNDAVSTVAAASDAVTHRMGAFIDERPA